MSKVVLITGASRGIGKQLAIDLAKRGDSIVLLANDADRLIAVEREIAHMGGKAIAIPCDVRDGVAFKAALAQTLQTFGRLDLAILNAGVGYTMKYSEFDETIFDAVIETNLTAAAKGMAWCAEIMKQQRSGTIVGIGSLADNRAIPGSSTYSASKAALNIIFETAAIELAPDGVKVITVRPGFVDTDMLADNVTPMPMLMSAQQVSKIILQCIDRGKRHVAFPMPIRFGAAILRLLPRSVWHWATGRNLTTNPPDREQALK